MAWGPQHDRPDGRGTALTGRRSLLPPVSDLVDDLRNGMTLDDMAETYDCHPHTIQLRVNSAGYSALTGEPLHQAEPADDIADLADLAKALPPLGPWAADALCAQVDPELFYPEKGGSTTEAKAICARCPVAAECLDYALALPLRHDYGIYGGTSPKQRRRLRNALNGEDALPRCCDCNTNPARLHSPRCAACAAERKRATDAAWWRRNGRPA